MPSSRVSRILFDLVEAGRGSPDGLPGRLVASCAKAVPVSGVGIVLMTSSGPAGVLAASDGPAQVVEDLQFTLGEGPCVDASRTGRPVLVADLARTGSKRWPAFVDGAMKAGVRAVFAYPLSVGGIRLGVLDLYRDRPGDLDDVEQRVAMDYSDASTAVLLHLHSRASEDSVSSTLVQVVEDRAEVHQATGVVSVQAGVELTEALVLLRARAFSTDRPVLDLARDVLARRVTFSDEAAGHPLRDVDDGSERE